MHEPIRDNLEEYLRGSAAELPADFYAHLEACDGCANELHALQAQAELLRALRPGREVEPRAGFYARVMDRIEAEGRASIWSILLEPAVGRRLAVACATLVLLLGTYFVATEMSEPMIAVAPSIAATASPITADSSTPQTATDEDSPQQQQQRDAVLVNLASFHE
ncbi:MAG TPA: hypothetical protein VKX49_31055 [Bryobacteraceae bacterium]|nr:hypothetical protein [Bryobacteraceae bacterium]